MATQNRRVAAYLPKEIGDLLEAFKAKSGIKSDSPALISILSEYFGVSREVAHSSSPSLMQRLEKLEDQLSESKSELLGELRNLAQRLDVVEVQLNAASSSETESCDTPSDILSELPSDFPDEKLTDEAFSNSQNEESVHGNSNYELENKLSINAERSESSEESLNDTPSNQESELLGELQNSSSAAEDSLLFPNLEQVNQQISVPAVKLAPRLGIDRKKLAKLWSELPAERFAELTSQKDPDGIAWRYLDGRKGLTPVGELQGEILSKLLSWRNSFDKE